MIRISWHKVIKEENSNGAAKKQTTVESRTRENREEDKYKCLKCEVS